MDIEKALKKAIRSGDKEETRRQFERFYQENVKLVYRVLIDRFGKVDGIDDDVQESFVVLMGSPEQLLAVDRLQDYLITTAKRIAQRRIYGLKVSTEEVENIPAPELLIPSAISEADFFHRMEQSLGHPDYEIVVLRFAYGFTEKEISKRLGIGEDAVHYRCKKGMAKLRKEISR
ncbi:MAG: sigma-70 family RNA polymerase sigma factor [Erysipelotrichaceae bacterium]|nr:sigma-70 family RNA polymerase sigma factor [Erysipelotrichaceae bacterium]